MSNPITALGSAVYSVLSAGTVDVYHSLAPQGATPPYAVFSAQNPGIDEYTFTSRGVSADYSVQVLSNRNWPTEAATVFTHLDALLQDASLNVSGYTALRCRRTSELMFRDNDGYWHVGAIYRIDIHE